MGPTWVSREPFWTRCWESPPLVPHWLIGSRLTELIWYSQLFWHMDIHKPEDNTPLQAQQEDVVMEKTPFASSTKETQLTAVVQGSGTLETPNWTPLTYAGLENRLFLGSAEWNTSSDTGVRLAYYPLPYSFVVGQDNVNPGGVIDNDTAVNANQFAQAYSAHGLYRSGYDVFVTINGTQFHSGSLMIVAVPNPHVLFKPLSGAPNASYPWACGDVYQQAQLGIFPSARLLPRTSSSVKLELPYIGAAPWKMTARQEMDWCVFVLVESKLGVPTGTTPVLTVVVEVAPRNVLFAAPKRPQIVSGLLGALTAIPTIPQPAMLETPIQRVAPGNAAIFSEVPASVKGTTWKSHPSLDYLPPKITHFQSLLSRPTVMALIEVQSGAGSQTNVGKVLASWDVSPTTDVVQAGNTSVKTVIGKPFLDEFSRFFMQWQGSLIYTLEYVGPAVSSGRLLLSYQPGEVRAYKNNSNAQPSLPSNVALRSLTTSPHIVWDLSNSTSISFRADFALPEPWGHIQNDRIISNSNEIGGVYTSSSSGSMYFAQLTPVITPQTAQAAFDVILHVSAGPDFNLRFFSPQAPLSFPVYNGVLDQGPVEVADVIGSDPLDDGILSVSNVLSHPRLIAKASFVQNKTLQIPLTLISYSNGTGTANNIRAVPGRLFPSLFTLLQADLRIIVVTSSEKNVLVAYRPPGVTNSVFGEVPLSAESLTQTSWTIMSSRADNVGFEIFVPYPGSARAFQTSLNTIQRSDLAYSADRFQDDPGSLGTILVANTDSKAVGVNNQSVAVFIAFENVSAFVPRPFGPSVSQIVQPTMLAHEDFEDEEATGVEYQAPLKRIQAEFKLTDEEIENGITDDGWEIQSLDEQLEWQDMMEEMEAEENALFFSEMPQEYPEGDSTLGIWINREWYRVPYHDVTPADMWDLPLFFTRARMVYDPSPRERSYETFWIDTIRSRNIASIDPINARQFIWARWMKLLRGGIVPRYLSREFQSTMDYIEMRIAAQYQLDLDSDDEGFFSESDEVGVRFEAPIERIREPESVQQPVSQTERSFGGEVITEDGEADDEPPPKFETPCVYKVNRGLYNHWGIGYRNTCISLRQVGVGARVMITSDLDLRKAVIYSPVTMKVWFQAVSAIGMEFPDYNVGNNCTHWVRTVSGLDIENSGLYLGLGLAVTATVLPFIFQSPKKRYIPLESQPLNWSEPPEEPKKTTRWAPLVVRKIREYKFKRCMFFGKREILPRKVDYFRLEAPININLTSTRMETQAEAATQELRNTLKTYSDMAPNLSAAITNAAASFQNSSVKASEFIEKMERLVDATTDFLPKAADSVQEAAGSLTSAISRRIGCMLLKVIGYVLIIFGNPNPATVAGVVALMAAEALDSRMIREKIKSVTTSLSHKIQSLFCSLFKVSVCDDDPQIFEDPVVDQAYNDYMRERVSFEAPNPHLTNFNQGILAMKNVEWVIEKIKDLIDYVISKLKNKKVENPESYLQERAEYIVKLYDDSVETGSCQNVNEKLLQKRLDEANEMLSYCVNHKLTSATPLLARTVTNYRTTQRKLAAASYEDRPEPLVVYIHGGPGVGKSVLSNIIARAYCKHRNIPFNSSVFTTPPGSEYFDGYTGQEVHIIDDFCQNTTGEDVKLFCQMVSTTRFSPPMASLEEKGVNYCSKLIIATSNLSTPQSNEIRIPAALERRCHFRVRTCLHPAFSTPQGRLDMGAAFKPVGPSKSPDFKQDCAYLNGAALTVSVIAGEERRAEKMSVYELMDLIYGELDRRQGCQDVMRNIVFEAPKPDDVRAYADGVIPTLCTHQDHENKNCFRVFFRDGQQVWHRDFMNETERRQFMEGYHLGKLPEGDEVRPCSCGNVECGKLLFFHNGSAKIFDFRSRSALDYFLFQNGKSFRLTDPDVFVSTVAKPNPKKDVEVVKKELLSLKKKCMISFAITALGAVSSIIAAVVYLCKRRRPTSEAAYSGMPGTTRVKDHKRPVPVRNVRYEAPSLLPQIYNRVHTNVVSMHFECPGYKPFDISGVGLFDRYIATCHHAMRLASHVTINGVKYAREDLNPIQVYRAGNPTDLVFCKVPDGNQFKDITRYFIGVKDKFPRDDCVLVSRAKQMVCNMQATGVRGLKTVTVQDDEPNTFHNVVAYDCPTMPGLCGAPVLSKNGARESILGIHFAGTGSVGLAVPIYREDFKILFEGDIKLIEHPGNPTHIPRKTNLQKSPAFGAFEQTHEPAILTKHDKRLDEGVVLDEVMFSKHKGDHEGWKTLEPAMAYVVNDLMGKLGFSPDEPIQPWTIEEAINGSGVMDAIPMNQSPGYPYNTQGRSRRSFFEWKDDKWIPTDELRFEVDKALRNPHEFYFSTFLKDEIRPMKKARAGKTRLVDGDSLPRVIAYRMVFGPLFERMLAKNGPEIHSAVGCDPDKDWTRFFHQMGPANYPYVFDLDYSCFDSSEPAISFDLMAKYFQPYFEMDVGPYFGALARSKHVYEGCAFEMIGGMPSGCVGTSMFNCVNNSAFIVSALIALKIDPSSVSWLCYGDDVIIATHEKALSRKIADFYHKHTPLVVTPASKSGDFPDESTIYEVTFLKRYFQPDSAYPDLIHPLMPLEHLQQSVMWKTDGPFQAKLDSLCMLAFHAGGDAYREFIRKVDHVCRTKGERFVFKPFEYLMAVWYGNFF